MQWFMVIDRLLCMVIAVFNNINSSTFLLPYVSHSSAIAFLLMAAALSSFLFFPFLLCSSLSSLVLIQMINRAQWKAVPVRWRFHTPMKKQTNDTILDHNWFYDFHWECRSVCSTNELNFIWQTTASIILLERRACREKRNEHIWHMIGDSSMNYGKAKSERSNRWLFWFSCAQSICLWWPALILESD